MERIPQISIILLLTKQDISDFDRNGVTQYLHIVPTETSEPKLGAGKVSYNSDMQEILSELKGVTMLPLSESTYQILKHAYWCLELKKIKSWKVEEALQKMEDIIKGKELQIKNVCQKYNLNSELIIRVYAELEEMPEISIVNSKIVYWAQLGVDVCFDFYMD